ncbi:hypothetical protein ACWGKQ_37735 [Streptomyces sp. NPDC054770]
MDQRTRERLPVLPVPADTVDRKRRATAELLAAAEQTRPGNLIPDTAATLRRAVALKAAGHLTSTGRRRNLTYEETEAFWAFAAPELADILFTMVRRLRGGSCAIPLVTSYDVQERVWNPPMPLLSAISAPNTDRGGVRRLPRALREAQGLHRHLRSCHFKSLCP